VQITGAQSLVMRSALFDRLSAVRPGNVALVCAPAGSGKSVLVRSWAQAEGLRDRLAWVSVQRGERDGQRFLLSVIEALAGVLAGMEQIAPAPGFRGELIVERLLAEVGSLDRVVALVVDDLHELRSDEALRWLALLVARLPSTMRLVLITREDPRLGLRRLRITGELTELRAPDLRFSPEETRELLRTAGVRLSDAGTALLQQRTEGWAAGLRLAAISLAHQPDPERFVREFSGSERTVAGYLVAEVLEHQPAEVRELLLRTSVLERVSGPLADHLTGNSGSEHLLQQLEDANAFVSSVDAARTWFRYHHLFAELLQLELRRSSPTVVGSLHRAAAEWYEQEGYAVEAVRHAQAARDWPHAARVLGDSFVGLVLGGSMRTVQELLDAFPPEARDTHAELALAAASADILNGALGQSAAHLELAGRLAANLPEVRWPRFELELAVIRLVLARWHGDLQTVCEAMQSVEAALGALPPAERPLAEDLRTVALLNLGVAELWSSRLDDARRDLERALALTRRRGRPYLEVTALGHLGIAAPWTGMSFAAGLRLSEQAMAIAEARGWLDDQVVVAGLANGAIALLWLGRFDEAEEWLTRAARVVRPGDEPSTELVVHEARGLLRLTQWRFDEALQAFCAVKRIQALLSDRHPFAASAQARLLQTQAMVGDVSSARASLAEIDAEERGTPAMRVAAAVIHLAGADCERSLELLAPLLDSPAPDIHLSVRTEAQVLDAAAREALGDARGAELSLERALELAEPEGLVLPFVLAPARGLIERLPRHRTAHATLLRTVLDVLAGSRVETSSKSVPFADELSDAELRVVRYLPSNLKAPEIAAELCVSANTVRTHIRHVYLKLAAHDRNDAVARARELGLLAPTLRSR
jgi:LuxR family transcriptional regulator, maltose regulon positive regulatory protein